MGFKLGAKKKLFEGKFLTVWGTEFLDKGGKPQLWEYVQKKDVVAVLPITTDGKAVLIRNYRVPLQKYVIESPAGLIDVDGESHEESAKRELLEEAGYEADTFHAFPGYPYKTGTSCNMIYSFIATGLKKVAHTTGDDTEDLSVIEVPLNGLEHYYVNLPPDTLFSIEILAMREMARFLKII